MQMLSQKCNNGIGGIDGCTETSIRWFLLASTVPLFVVVCLLPVVQNAAAFSDQVSRAPLVKDTTQTSYEYGREIITSLSFRDNLLPQPITECKKQKKKRAGSAIFAGSYVCSKAGSS